MCKPAEPLDPTMASEFQADGFGHLLVKHSTGIFNREDLVSCKSCGALAIDPLELNTMGLCDNCALEYTQDIKHYNSLKSDYYKQCL